MRADYEHMMRVLQWTHGKLPPAKPTPARIAKVEANGQKRLPPFAQDPHEGASYDQQLELINPHEIHEAPSSLHVAGHTCARTLGQCSCCGPVSLPIYQTNWWAANGTYYAKLCTVCLGFLQPKGKEETP